MLATPALAATAIDSFRRAAETNRGTPTRRGNVIELSAELADDVLITADLHGHRPNFEALLRVANLGGHPRRHLVLQEVCHGGPSHPEGGCMSHILLADVARQIAEFPGHVHFILSNHELAELTDYPIVKGRRMLNLAFRCGMREAYGAAAEEVHAACLDFLRSCPLAVRLPGGVLVCHSLPEQADVEPFDATLLDRALTADDYRPGGPLFRLVWGRDYRPENARAFADQVGARVLVHGHEPCPDGYKVPNELQVILDCSDRPACYLMLPVGPELTHAEIVERIAPLPVDA